MEANGALMENIGQERWETIISFRLSVGFQGAGRARVEPHSGFTLDLFVTHTCAVGPSYSNAYYRESQVGFE